MKKIFSFALVLIVALSMCACGGGIENGSETNGTDFASDIATEAETTTEQANAVVLTIDNIEQYLSFEVSKEMSEYNTSGADHILKVTPLVEGDYSGVNIIVEVPLYDNWYNSYTKEIDLTADVILTKAGAYTAKHPIFRDEGGNLETRSAQGEDDPSYIIKFVSGTVK